MSLAATPTAPLATTLFTTRIPWALLLALLAVRTAAESSADAATSMAGFCQDLPRPAYAELTRVPDSVDDWFELYTVATGVTAIYEPHQWQEAISYLIRAMY